MNNLLKKIVRFIFLVVFLGFILGIFIFKGAFPLLAAQEMNLLNVSYDPTRNLYQQIKVAFLADRQARNETIRVSISHSHGGSGKQARGVIDGLEADVVTLALAGDIDAITSKSGLIAKDWQSRLPNNSVPFFSTIVMMTRQGNPKNIKDWEDLTKEGVVVVTPNPKTSGGARWNYLAIWGAALKKYPGDSSRAKEIVRKVYQHVPVLDTGARASTATFVKRDIGDVLLIWENEAYLAKQELGQDKFEIIYPTWSILAEPAVAWVDKVVEKKGTRAIAEEYLRFLFSDRAQEIGAENYYRPSNKTIYARYQKKFPELQLFTLAEFFGDWGQVQQKHFADGGIFDDIYLQQ